MRNYGANYRELAMCMNDEAENACLCGTLYNETAFIDAVVHKYRFPGPHGGSNLTAEDLFDLTLDELDLIYRALTREKREKESTDSLIHPVETDQTLANKISIVKAVAEYLQAKTAKADEEREANARLRWALRKRDSMQRDNVTMEQLDEIIKSGGKTNPFKPAAPAEVENSETNAPTE